MPIEVMRLADVDVDVQVSGEAGAPAVVLLHGSADSPAAWGLVAMDLAREFRVYAPQLPRIMGVGSQLALDLDKPWLGALIAQTGARTLAAHSYGALLAMRWAIEHPHALSGLVLAEPIAWGLIRGQPGQAGDAFAELEKCVDLFMADDQGTAIEWLVNYWNGKGFWQSFPPRIQAALLATAPRTCAEVMSGNADRTHPAELALLPDKVEILCGMETPAESKAVQLTLHNALPQARLTMIDQAGHKFLRSHAAIVAAAIRRVA